METMWIIWLTATFITRMADTVTTTGLLTLPELPMQRRRRAQSLYGNHCFCFFPS
jgi:hypothetical protein